MRTLVYPMRVWSHDRHSFPLPAGHRFPLGKNLGGGTHHAGRGSAKGFCVLNDVALATVLHGRRTLVVDCDVHHGEGTAEILGLALTNPGLRARDALVLDRARDAGAAVCVVLAGGYAPDLRDTVAINLATVRAVVERAGRP